MFNRSTGVGVLVLPLVLVICATVDAAPVRRVRPVPGAAGMVNLPYMTSDSQGNQWMVYQPGTLQMQGNMPVYSQAGQITINGNQPGMQNNMAKLDEKNSELILENMTAGTFTLTRRMQFNAEECYVRVIDVIKNTQGQDQQANVQITSNLNFGVQAAAMVADPKKKDQNIAWVAATNGQGRAAVDVYAGRGSKVAPSIMWPQGNSYVQATLNVAVPAGKEIALVHLHGTAATQDAGVQWVNGLKDEKLLGDLPRELRKIIVNFRARQSLLGDLEVLRGDVLDAVELRSGDKFNGNLREASFKLDTFYGAIDLPAERVVCILNTGQFRPRQLILSSDGQIFGGHLQKQTIELELSSGQRTQIPLAQINRVGYRFRAGESEETISEQPMLQPPYVLMSSGDRVGVEMPAAPITVVTRYGQLQLSPEIVASIAFTAEDSGVHVVTLTDGSRFSGLVTAPAFDIKLSSSGGGSGGQAVKFPVSAMSRFVVKNRPEEKEDSAPTLQMRREDVLVGTLVGELKLDTAFDTITLSAPELRGLSHPRDNAPDVSVTTWDGTVFSGQLAVQEVLCRLSSGLEVPVPVALIQSYSNPSSKAPTMMLERIQSIVAELNADDWKQRDAAEKQLVALGPPVVATLKSLRDKQPPEAQQRIDSVIRQLEKQAKPPRAEAPASPAGPGGMGGE